MIRSVRTRGRGSLKRVIASVTLALLLMYLLSRVHDGSAFDCITAGRVITVSLNSASSTAALVKAYCSCLDHGIIPPADSLLAMYEEDYRAFEEIEIGDKIVYFQQRMLDEAFVEKDFVSYQFDKNSQEFLSKKTRWRSDLPDRLPAGLLSRRAAESKVSGEVQFSKLYIISPESDVFPVTPTPRNPCWVVRSIDGEHLMATIIDAVNGTVLGTGVPPPSSAFSMSGPQYFEPCGGVWYSWYTNAESWFNEMGYPTEAVEWPTEERIRSHLQSNETAMFYEIAHSGGRSDQFKSGCHDGTEPEYTYAYEIEEWIANYTKMPFAFLASCFSMCNISDGSLSYEFRKGSTRNTVTIGYCNMSDEQCHLCWTYSLDWQDALFHYMNQSYTIRDAFDQANAEYPVCAITNCMRYAGDADFKVVPIVTRVPFEHDIAITDLSPAKSIVGQGFALCLNTFVENQGSHPETFNLTAYANTTIVGTVENLTLTSGQTATLAFTWNTTNMPKGTYGLSVVATPVPDETDTTNNALVAEDGVSITIPGDVDGDRDVDIFDIVAMIGVYGSKRPEAQYDPVCDVNDDGDIDIFDVVIAAGNYGESW
jgi:hypothetical protein